jgi:hypothetical protein
MVILNQARDELSTAFEALSADALRKNNESFLDLAKTTMERFQGGARTDLAGAFQPSRQPNRPFEPRRARRRLKRG